MSFLLLLHLYCLGFSSSQKWMVFISEGHQISNVQQNSQECGGFRVSFPVSGNYRVDDECVFHLRHDLHDRSVGDLIMTLGHFSAMES